MLHRAMFGSLERFFGILLEHHAGRLPDVAGARCRSWSSISPTARPITRPGSAESLKNQGLRAEVDLRNEKVGFKIREHTLQRVPYLLVAGDREVQGKHVGRAHAQRSRTWARCPSRRSASKLGRGSREPRPHCFGGLKYRCLNRKRIRRNEEITAPQLRVIGADGEQVGVMSRDDALQLAQSQELDLVEISPTAEPPVCRVMDFGKFLFETEQEGPRGEAQAEADPGQGSEVSSRNGRRRLPDQAA